MHKLYLFGLLLVAGSAAAFAQPANDNCAGAIPIGVDTVVAFTTVDATNEGPVVTGCGGFTPPENDSIPADIWFIYTATEAGTMSWSNCGTGVFDSRMAVYLGTDPCAITNDDLVNCNDDGNTCANAESDLVFNVAAGSTYVLRLGGFANEDIPITTGSGTVLLTKLDVPINNDCANATAITLGVGQEYSTINATTDGPNHSGTNPCFQFNSLTVAQDIWYTFTPDFSGSVEWVNCGAINYDSRMAVYSPGSSCPPAPEDLYGCNDDGPACPAGSFHSDLFFEVEAGMTYLLRLGGFGDEAGLGTFDLINNTPPEAPSNDDCANAISTIIITREEADSFDEVQVGTTLGATFDEDNFRNPDCNPFNPGGLWGDVWYTVETQGNDSIEMRIFPDGDDAQTDFFMDVFASCTDTLAGSVSGTCLFVDGEDNRGLTQTITGLPAENITIYIRVATRLTTQAPGSFGFQLIGDISTGTDETPLTEALTLFPNPASEEVTVRLTLAESTNMEARVLDLLGRNVLTRQLGNLASGEQQFTLQTGDLAAGVYSLWLTNGRASQQLKFIIN